MLAVRLPGEVIFGMSNAGNLDAIAAREVNTFISNIQELVAKTESSDVIRANITRDIKTFINQEKIRIEAGLPNIAGAVQYVRLYRVDGRFNHGVFISNQMPKNCLATRTEASVAKNNNIKLHAMGKFIFILSRERERGRERAEQYK